MKKNLFITVLLFILLDIVLLTYIVTPRSQAVQKVTDPTPQVSVTDDEPVIDLKAEKVTTIVNKWRISEGMEPYIKDERACKISDDRLKDGFDQHEGFYKKVNSNYYNLPTNVTLSENEAMSSSEKEIFLLWYNSPKHRENLGKPYKYSCISCKENLCVQIFSNF